MATHVKIGGSFPINSKPGDTIYLYKDTTLPKSADLNNEALICWYDDIRFVESQQSPLDTKHWIQAGEECPHCGEGHKLVDLYWDQPDVGCTGCGREYQPGTFYQLSQDPLRQAVLEKLDRLIAIENNKQMHHRDIRGRSKAEREYAERQAEKNSQPEPEPKTFPAQALGEPSSHQALLGARHYLDV